MLTIKEYVFEGEISQVENFIETDPYPAALKSEIAVYTLPGIQKKYVLLVASRRLVHFIETLKEQSPLAANDSTRMALQKDAFPLTYGSGELKALMRP